MELKKQICRRNLENRAIAIGSNASERTQHIMNLFKNQRRRTETNTLDRKCSWQNNYYLLQKLLAWWRIAKERTSKTAWNVETGQKKNAERLFQQGYQQLELFHHQLKQQLLYLEAHMNVNQGGATFCTSIHSKGCFFIFILGSRILDCITRMSKQLQAQVTCIEWHEASNF